MGRKVVLEALFIVMTAATLQVIRKSISKTLRCWHDGVFDRSMQLVSVEDGFFTSPSPFEKKEGSNAVCEKVSRLTSFSFVDVDFLLFLFFVSVFSFLSSAFPVSCSGPGKTLVVSCFWNENVGPLSTMFRGAWRKHG